ncbi:lipopolysaccharide biosynthesis protein [Vibrio sp. 1075]|uniref:lipopolysaccharide biosynthesis protein n=1 Tax=Vibrio sp. 1075 TaxID=3074543 RepID=UPI002963EF3D|nr:lipopolysaccharide biosynthesis protein [Vibrio sp. 1075]MDW2309493.1 lipopolysaccharide biosynthesis protein [Vibrio sp. 1075]
MTNLKKKTVSGLKWSLIERFATQGVQVIVMLILGRMLGPSVFGTIALLMVFISICQVIADSGMSSALIRKHDRTNEDFSTAFICNVVISVISYLVVYISAPLVSAFFDNPELTFFLRVLGIVIPLNAFSFIPKVKANIDMNFRVQAKISLFALIISSSISITLAYKGYNEWALVVQYIVTSLLTTILFLTTKYRVLVKTFSVHSFIDLFGFGSKLLLASLIDTIYQNIYQIFIGKITGPVNVGYFTVANQITRLPSTSLSSVIQRVTYPMLSSIRCEKELDASFSRILEVTMLFTIPLMVFVGLSSDFYVGLILGEDWSQIVNMVISLSFAFSIYPVHVLNLNYLNVKGRSDIFLKIEIIKKIQLTVIILSTYRFGLEVICYGIMIQSFMSFFYNAYYVEKLGSIKVTTQYRMIFFYILSSGLIGIFLKLIISKFLNEDMLSLLSMVLLYVLTWFLLIIFFKKDVIDDFKVSFSEKRV